jgi:hypothetical protein
MVDPFEDPVTATPLPYTELQGSLLLFRVLSYEEHVPTSYTIAGERSPAIRANVTVLDGTLAGENYVEVLVFPKKLQAQLRARVGKMVLGRLGQGEARKGQNAPWELIAATPQDKALAMRAVSDDGRPSDGPASSQASVPAQSAEPPF